MIEKLPILILEPHSRCNCRCRMCDIWKVETVEEIRAADLERQAGEISALGVEWVVFSGGEPLMHSGLFRLAARLREMGIRTTALSTGLLLEKHAPAVAATLDEVIVSLDGPPQVHDRIRGVARAFDLLARGVRALRGRRPDFPVAARSTVQKANHAHLWETAETARALGLRSISFLAADVTSTAFHRPEGWPPERQHEVALAADEIPVLEAQIEALARLPDGFVLESPEKLRRIVRHFRAYLGQVEPQAPRCNAPWVSAVWEPDGTLRPCFFHPAYGRLGEAALREVLNSPRAVEFREGLKIADDPTCRRCVCSLYRQGFGWSPK